MPSEVSGYEMLKGWLEGDMSDLQWEMQVCLVTPYRGDASANAAIVTRADGRKFLVAVVPHEPPEESGEHTGENHEHDSR